MNYGILADGVGARLLEGCMSKADLLRPVGGDPLLLLMCRQMAGPDTEGLHLLLSADVREAVGREVECIEANCELVCPSEAQVTALAGCDQLLASYARRAGKVIVASPSTVMHPADWQQYVRAFQLLPADVSDGLFVVTLWQGEPEPLYVLVDADTLDVLAFADDPADISPTLGRRADGSRRHTRLYVSGGVMGLCRPHEAHQLARRCLKRGETSMRQFERSLLRSHLRLKAFVVGRIVDVTGPDDVRRAEHFVQL